eukprot:gb/GEZN01003664.1/.p1 GENE.gb/GEZN01003664.1/~~gb/GEZN01003664.1/.p1  ORF type:complete len:645 (+),score=131.03 gb/GEZN01003664.1/:59-1936(+)
MAEMSWGESSASWTAAYSEEEDPDAPSLDSKENKFKDVIVAMIDASSDMFEMDPQGETYFNSSLKYVLKAFKNKIITEPNSSLSVIFFNTKNKRNESEFDGIYVFQELSEPNATMIKKLETMMDPKHFRSVIGSAPRNSCELYKALWTSSGVLTEKPLKDCFKRVWLFTNNDVPFNNEEQRLLLINKMRDLADLDIEIILAPFHKKEQDFDVKKFYWDHLPIDEDEGKPGEPFRVFDDLDSTFFYKIMKKRTLGSCNMELAPGINVAVNMYVLLRMARVESSGFVDRKTNDPLTCQTNWVCGETAAQLEPFQIKSYYPYGGENVFFDKEELKTIKYFGEPGLVLMGFKPKSRLKQYYQLKNPYFLYPNNESIKGSVTAFSALLSEMEAMNKIAIARLIYRKGSLPRFVALVPQLEKKDETGAQECPPGMHMIFLPYKDDIRSLQFDPMPIAEPYQVDAAKQVVRAMQDVTGAKYGEYDMENPVLQRHYTMLHALALDEEKIPEVPDKFSTPEGAEKHKEKIIAFAESIYGDEYEVDEETGEQKSQSAAKRKPAASRGAGGGPAAKRAKTEAMSPEDLEFVKEAFDAHETSKLKVAQLKEFCRAKGLPVSGTKGVLIDRIEDFLSK